MFGCWWCVTELFLVQVQFSICTSSSINVLMRVSQLSHSHFRSVKAAELVLLVAAAQLNPCTPRWPGWLRTFAVPRCSSHSQSQHVFLCSLVAAAVTFFSLPLLTCLSSLLSYLLSWCCCLCSDFSLILCLAVSSSVWNMFCLFIECFHLHPISLSFPNPFWHPCHNFYQ